MERDSANCQDILVVLCQDLLSELLNQKRKPLAKSVVKLVNSGEICLFQYVHSGLLVTHSNKIVITSNKIGITCDITKL